MELNENNLRPNVLKDLIYDIISLDEYTPKIGDDNIVVQFQVLDNFDAAYDLSSFLERAPLNIIDTEAVEIPNVDGRYDVFVEFERTAEFPIQLLKMITILKNICNTEQWKLQVYGKNDPIDLDEDKVQSIIRLSTPKQVQEFFNKANANATLTENFIEIGSRNNKLIYSKGSGIVSESYVKELLKNVEDDNSTLSSMVGENYIVLKSEDAFICNIGEKYFLLR